MLTIKKVDNDGDLTGVSKKSRAATAKKMGPVAGARANQIKSRSESGFKGEDKNDHGLPMGGSEVIQSNKYDNEGGAKFRKEKYANGVKGIKLKKPSVANDATATAALTTPYTIGLGIKSRLSKLSDDQLKKEHSDNMSMSGPSNDIADRALNELAERQVKKKEKYKAGTKGIKLKNK